MRLAWLLGEVSLKINVTNDMIERSTEFANSVIDTNVNQYARRNQGNREKILKDICVGKIAEFAVHHYFKIHGVDCTEPDVNIYQAKKKNFGADLITTLDSDITHVHVKSQLMSSANRYGMSWMFQQSDSLITRPKPSDTLALCLTEDDLSTVELKGILSATSVIERYKLPKLPQLYSKRALYYDDIKDLARL